MIITQGQEETLGVMNMSLALMVVMVFCFFKRLLFLILFIYWLHWVFAACGLSLVVVSRGCSSLQCTGFSSQWLLLLQSVGSRWAGFGSCSTRAQ